MRIIPAHRKYRHEKGPVHVHGAAIYAAKKDLLSRPIIGHTPRKLPARAAISRIIALIGRANTGKPIHALRKLNYCTRLHRSCQEGFSLFYSFFYFTPAPFAQKGQGRNASVSPGRGSEANCLMLSRQPSAGRDLGSAAHGSGH